MEKAKKARAARRTAFTRALNAVNGGLKDAPLNLNEIEASMQLLEEKYTDLEAINAQIFDFLIDNNAEQSVIDQEMEAVDEYKFIFLQKRNEVVKTLNNGMQKEGAKVENALPCEPKKNFRLPKIELKKFSGDIKDWLQFWSQFKKIHEDESIVAEDKFQYLIQAMLPNSRAYELVQSFPPTAENYGKVIVSLKNRFGRDDLLVEVYVRELLRLVLQNAVKPNESIRLSSLYDKIESHLRALETLGVATDKCAAMLFPLVESSLPEELLRAWQRSTSVSNGNAENAAKDRLTRLIDFLRSEVENEQRISMAMNGFSLNAQKSKKTKPRSETHKDIPTAMGLLTTKPVKNITCIFCGSEHESAECDKARKMSFFERRKIIKDKNCCYNCLKYGHNCKNCRVNIRCAWCSKHHYILMCPEFSKGENENKDCTPCDAKEEKNLASFLRDPDVILQTIRVKLRNDVKESIVRAIIDTGSMKSYILKSAVERMGYTPEGEQVITHSLFGGAKSSATKHRSYMVGSLDGRYFCRFNAFDQDVICGNIASIKRGQWVEELQHLKIEPPDMSEDESTIQLLIGADIAGKLFTGNTRILKNGLTAIETLLGWTIMGKIPSDGQRKDSSLTTISLFVKEANISDLWELDVLGIKDPFESKSKKDHEDKILSAFLENVKVNEDGRYEVQLPWRENHPTLENNRELAIRRLESTTRKLKVNDLFEKYDQVFDEWKSDGIIEQVPASEVTKWGHYLPHRPVLKENSSTKIRPVFDASSHEKDSPSLNQCLEIGPNLIELIPSILLRFRKCKYGVISDIKRAFLQISIHPKDRDFLRFLWYDKSGKVIILRHARVVFGVSCSPFLLGAVIDLHLKRVMQDELSRESMKYCPRNITKLSESFYVDNSVTSVNNVDEISSFISDAKMVMKTGGFELRGWEFSGDSLDSDKSPVLGIIWDKNKDVLSINVPCLDELYETVVTKRSMLSLAHRIFDPLGVLSLLQ